MSAFAKAVAHEETDAQEGPCAIKLRAVRKDNDARNHHAVFEITMREHEDPEATIYKSACIRSYFLKMLQWGHPSACGVTRRNEELPLE